MIVVDASVVVDVLLDAPPRSDRLRVRLADTELPFAAPHLLDAEVGHLMRRVVLRGELASNAAAEALQDLIEMPIERYPHGPLLIRAFELRNNASFYDALYIALAEALDARLVTRDAALARVPGARAKVELIG